MKLRLLADENTSHRLISSCHRYDPLVPIIHISDWQQGACRSLKDTALLMVLQDARMVLVSFDRASLPMHAVALSREALGHSGVILFRGSVGVTAYRKQASLLVTFWHKARSWDWSDRIEYLPALTSN